MRAPLSIRCSVLLALGVASCLPDVVRTVPSDDASASDTAPPVHDAAIDAMSDDHVAPAPDVSPPGDVSVSPVDAARDVATADVIDAAPSHGGGVDAGDATAPIDVNSDAIVVAVDAAFDASRVDAEAGAPVLRLRAGFVTTGPATSSGSAIRLRNSGFESGPRVCAGPFCGTWGFVP